MREVCVSGGSECDEYGSGGSECEECVSDGSECDECGSGESECEGCMGVVGVSARCVCEWWE